MTPARFHDLLIELVDEDPFALRAVLKLLTVEFTEAVPTLAVTCEARPRLLVNFAFVQAQCRTDAEVKAVLCHELLHVLLRHTEAAGPSSPAQHLALDAVINAVIHRQLGPGASSMMSRNYAEAEGAMRLLRPPSPGELAAALCDGAPAWARAWQGLYAGRLVADDIEALALDLQPRARWLELLLGGHDELGRPLPAALRDALEAALDRMNGSGLWRSPRACGAGGSPYDLVVPASDERAARWERKTLEVLRRHLQPDPRARALESSPRDHLLPVLSPGDRRAFVRALWQPFLPDARWSGTAPRRLGSAQVYLDVSGSMGAEMPRVVRLLARLSAWIRRPFWAFSDRVAPAVIERGLLRAPTSGGTSLSCVLEHLARTRPHAAVVLTDGYVEQVRPELVAAVRGVRLHALVTRDGDPALLQRAGIPYTQLEKVPR